MVDLMMFHCERAMNRLNPHALPHEPTVSNTKLQEENNTRSKGEKVEQKQSRINKLINGYDFGWKMPSTHKSKK